MADTNGGAASSSQEGTDNVLYKAPAHKSVKEIMSTDDDDESLRVYKAKLLGVGGETVVIGALYTNYVRCADASNAKNVLVRGLSLVVEGREDVTIDLTTKLDTSLFVIKEGCHYRLRVNFHVQREIVAGLKYVQRVSRLNVPVDKDEFMVGSYGPKMELQSFTTPVEEAPSGMMHRGTYKVKSCFTDDDGNEWLAWVWTLEIKKDWK